MTGVDEEVVDVGVIGVVDATTVDEVLSCVLVAISDVLVATLDVLVDVLVASELYTTSVDEGVDVGADACVDVDTIIESAAGSGVELGVELDVDDTFAPAVSIVVEGVRITVEEATAAVSLATDVAIAGTLLPDAYTEVTTSCATRTFPGALEIMAGALTAGATATPVSSSPLSERYHFPIVILANPEIGSGS